MRIEEPSPEDRRAFEDELARDRERLRGGAADWRQWWTEQGERELRCILMTAWNPIGVGHTASSWDEYDNYLPGVAHRIRDRANDDDAVETVGEYLDHVERDYMHRNVHTSQQNQFLAETLVAWHRWSFLWRHRRPRR
jgi:hypothetical protein